ncbi:type II toxin-antitoxin system HicB family antitoxin [Halovivax limisalsi]|uniref:type II toxin-antitoxin system HicB family antitoxin n=1 Tax=Halovivax limisalsi TaxID=1453760 RepID=UPI001FFD2B48|nr:type II toxin-antitoxin system HicB family antitoxin [Halovivax limisalsi]
MSTDIGSNDATSVEARITLTKEDEWWVATDEHTDVTSQGKTRESALDNLDEAVAGYEGEGRPPTQKELDAVGIDPDENESGDSIPDVLE